MGWRSAEATWCFTDCKPGRQTEIARTRLPWFSISKGLACSSALQPIETQWAGSLLWQTQCRYCCFLSSTIHVIHVGHKQCTHSYRLSHAHKHTGSIEPPCPVYGGSTLHVLGSTHTTLL